MKRRTLLAMGAGTCMLTAMSYVLVAGPSTVTGPQRAAAGPMADCPAAGVATSIAAGVGTAPHAVTFASQTLLVTTELGLTERPAEMVGATAAASDGGTIVVVVDAKGPDRLLLSTDAGGSWTPIANGPDLAYPAVSPSGRRVAWSAAGALTIAAAASGWKPVTVAAPGTGKQLAEYVRFVDEDRLLLSVEVAVPGVEERFAALSDVWTVDHGSGTWSRLTTGVADQDRWSLAKTPIMAKDGSVLYVRHTGLGSGTDADLRTELRRVAGGVDSAITELPDRWGLVALDADGAVLRNAPDEHSRWQLVRAEPDGTKTALGCGRAAWAPSLNHDPDYTP